MYMYILQFTYTLFTYTINAYITSIYIITVSYKYIIYVHKKTIIIVGQFCLLGIGFEWLGWSEVAFCRKLPVYVADADSVCSNGFFNIGQ